MFTYEEMIDLVALGSGHAGWRPRAYASSEWPSGLLDEGPPDDVEQGLTFVGLVGMIDPFRTKVAAAVTTCRSAGIRPIMITGDHPVTARAVARELGIATCDRVLTGAELARLSAAELDQAASEVSVFALVTPEHKLRIVGSLQDQSHVVAMTGDGVNDAPALKRADVGVAMGITGAALRRHPRPVEPPP